MEVASFSKDALFASFYLASLLRERPDVADRVWTDVICILRVKSINGLSKPITYSFAHLNEALKYLSTVAIAKKVVIAAGQESWSR